MKKQLIMQLYMYVCVYVFTYLNVRVAQTSGLYCKCSLGSAPISAAPLITVTFRVKTKECLE